MVLDFNQVVEAHSQYLPLILHALVNHPFYYLQAQLNLNFLHFLFFIPPFFTDFILLFLLVLFLLILMVKSHQKASNPTI